MRSGRTDTAWPSSCSPSCGLSVAELLRRVLRDRRLVRQRRRGLLGRARRRREVAHLCLDERGVDARRAGVPEIGADRRKLGVELRKLVLHGRAVRDDGVERRRERPGGVRIRAAGLRQRALERGRMRARPGEGGLRGGELAVDCGQAGPRRAQRAARGRLLRLGGVAFGSRVPPDADEEQAAEHGAEQDRCDDQHKLCAQRRRAAPLAQRARQPLPEAGPADRGDVRDLHVDDFPPGAASPPARSDESPGRRAYPRDMAVGEHRLDELERVADEQAALRRIATLVAGGATESDLAAAVSSEIGGLFGAQSASVVRWDGDTIRVIGSWVTDAEDPRRAGAVLSYGGDTLTARVVETAAPARVDSAEELKTEFGRQRWAELGLQASIGAPILVDRKVWGVVAASRTEAGDTFPPGDEERLRDFSALVAQAIVNAEARRETAALVAEQSSLRQIATLVAGGRPQAAVLEAVTAEAGILFGASTVALVHWEGVQDEVVVTAAWSARGAEPVEPGSRYHPDPHGPTLGVLETGSAARGFESSPERGPLAVIAAPVIATGSLFGALTATRAADDPFPAGAEMRLRSFADLTAQSIANERAQAELRASRARIVRTADEARRRLERNLHDGAQQRLVSVSLALRLVEQMLVSEPSTAHGVLH